MGVPTKVQCCIAGGGPAGLMLGYLLARAGVDVAVLEKHADFLRDFRGDTVHASTLRLLDELGLSEQFARIPHRLIDKARMEIEGDAVSLDFSRLPGAALQRATPCRCPDSGARACRVALRLLCHRQSGVPTR